jgi:glycosyltransferase involved in cell wall biosynthesis
MPDLNSGAAPRVSVLVTVYNRENYLAACLDSILASTMRDFEVVVTDDRSTDGSMAIAEHYAALDNRIRVYRNERNVGDYRNRMQAARLARGEYLKYVDSDDLIYQHGLAVMVDAMDRNPDAALGLSHSRPEHDSPYPFRLSPHDAWERQFLGDGSMGCGPTGAIIRREEFFEAGGFGDWGVLSDTDMWYRMSARWPLVLLQPGLVWWRRHEQQEFTRNGAGQTYLESGFRLDVAALNSKDSPLTPGETKSALARAKQHHARRLLALSLKRGNPVMGWRLMNKSGLTFSDMVSGLKPYR